jgi:hypothetical protein
MPASESRQPKAHFLICELGRETWPDFERIMEKHNGVLGGCWCVAFHPKPDESNPEPRWQGADVRSLSNRHPREGLFKLILVQWN